MNSAFPSDAERAARLALSCVVEAGDVRVAAAVAAAGPEHVWHEVAANLGRGAWSRRVAAFDADQMLERTAKVGARYIIPGDAEWPLDLDSLANCTPRKDRGGIPIGLWLRGPLNLADVVDRRGVAVVGSRMSTTYGERIATDLGAALSSVGHPVISGGAYGIDAAAHRGALAAEGTTVAVLACGIDVGYPKPHHAMFEEIAHTGLLISELPLGEHPTRVRFLGRNRLIAALCHTLVVVEAAARSGAINSATWAADLRRVVAAVPGPVNAAQSEGCHNLIRSTDQEHKVTLVTNAKQVLDLVAPLGALPLDPPATEQRPTDGWDGDKLAVFEALPARGGMDASSIALKAGLPIGPCLGLLGELLCEGFVGRSGDDRWRVTRVPNKPVPNEPETNKPKTNTPETITLPRIVDA